MKKYILASLVFLFVSGVTRAQSPLTVPDMLKQALPAVVTVAVEKTKPGQVPYGFAGSDIPIAYRRLLDLTNIPSTGSGFVIEHQGRPYVITNAHVIQGAAGDEALFVYSIDQTKYAVKVIGGDSFYDIAVLAFTSKPGAELRTLSFRQDLPQIGETVFAIGNPLGDYPYSVSDGIIGGMNRVLNGLTAKFGYLQSTATVTWGNSGGPLVDTKGYVVGINTQLGIAEQGRQAVIQPQLNFALEAGLAQRLVNDILTNDGRVRRAFVGVEIGQYKVIDRQRKSYSVSPPVLIGVMPGSPATAALSGKQGYRVVRVGDIATRNVEEVLGALEAVRPGETVVFSLQHRPDSKQEQVSVQTAELTQEHLKALAQYAFAQHGAVQVTEEPGGVRLQTTTQSKDNVRFYTYDGGWVKSEKTASATLTDVIVAAGSVDQSQAESMWRVKSLADLGIAVRLSGLTGRIHVVPQSGGGDAIVELWLGDSPDTLAQTLFY